MRFAAMDRNNDGVISRDEWRRSPRSFEVHDWNGDGVLADDEVRIGAQRNTDTQYADHDPSRAERYLSWTDAGFANLDHNRDRRITADEWRSRFACTLFPNLFRVREKPIIKSVYS